MAKNGDRIKKNSSVSNETLRELVELNKIGNRAVRKAQEENRKLGIPNWYSIDGVIISDQEIKAKSEKVKR